MTSTLERLAGATRDDVLPGYVLSEPRLREIGAAVSEFQRQAIDATRTVNPDGFDALLAHIEQGKLDYGSDDFNRLRNEGTNPVLMLRWCLWRHAVSADDAAALFLAAEDRTALMGAVSDLWGYVPVRRRARAEKPYERTDWKRIIRKLREKGLSRDEALNLTWPQALNELGWDGESLSREDIEAKRNEATDKAFDKVCEHLGITHEALPSVPTEHVVAAVIATAGPKAKCDPAKLPQMIQGYIERKNRG